MADIVWPINTAPGYRAQDGSGRLINVYAEPRQNQQGVVYRRVPGATVFTTILASTGRWTGTGTASFVAEDSGGVLFASSGVADVIFAGTVA